MSSFIVCSQEYLLGRPQYYVILTDGTMLTYPDVPLGWGAGWAVTRKWVGSYIELKSRGIGIGLLRLWELIDVWKKRVGLNREKAPSDIAQ